MLHRRVDQRYPRNDLADKRRELLPQRGVFSAVGLEPGLVVVGRQPLQVVNQCRCHHSSAFISSKISQLFHIIRGTWKQPFQRLPFNGTEMRPSRWR